MKICIVSDSHDRASSLADAARAARAQGAEAVLHCGDVIGSHTLRPLLEAGLPVHVIHGNNLGDAAALYGLAAASAGLIRYHGQDAQLTLGGRRVFMVHYPLYGRALAATGDWDLVCCGHSHRVEIAAHANLKGGTTWLVNPGTVAGVGAPATYVLGDLAEMRFSVYPLDERHG
ncbi:MAG: metallophosphoesterase family protein [Pseudomonadota bacterium]|jgi:hypothetical protein